ncbi:MAG: aldo/keto reductase [Lachnospiraceae bacterium]|nr:aldo/keto reductase [Lachnospiraceae bacterium]
MGEIDVKGTGKLGFGLMRLPRKGISIDIPHVSHMVDLFMEAGLNYFDTAFVYVKFPIFGTNYRRFCLG